MQLHFSNFSYIKIFKIFSSCNLYIKDIKKRIALNSSTIIYWLSFYIFPISFHNKYYNFCEHIFYILLLPLLLCAFSWTLKLYYFWWLWFIKSPWPLKEQILNLWESGHTILSADQYITLSFCLKTLYFNTYI